MAPDGSPIFTRDTGYQEIYALNIRWPRQVQKAYGLSANSKALPATLYGFNCSPNPVKWASVE